MTDKSSDRALMALLELEADGSPAPSAAATGQEGQPCLATLDERVDMLLRAVHGSEHTFTAAAGAAARERILTAMAADIAEEMSTGQPSSPDVPKSAAARSENRATCQSAWSLGGLARMISQLGLPALEGFAMRAARMAAAPLVALLVIAAVWTGTYLGPMSPPNPDDARADRRTTGEPSAAPTIRGLAPPAETPQTAEAAVEQKNAAERSADNLAARRPAGSSLPDAPRTQAGIGPEEALRREIANAETALGLTHPELAEMAVKLASLYQSQARYGEAEALYNRALAIKELALGPSHLDIARTLEQLAVVYRAQGRSREAEELAKRVLSIVESNQRR
jgi:hypothetical protein